METTEIVKENLKVWKHTLSFRHRIEWMLHGTIKVDDGSYIFNCDYHGITSSKPQGHDERLVCLKCFNELYEDREMLRLLEIIEVNTK